MNCCVVVLCLFFSDSLTWSADIFVSLQYKLRGVDVEKYACYVNKLRQNVGLETENDVKLWRHKERTPNTNDHHMTLNEPPWKFSAYATDVLLRSQWNTGNLSLLMVVFGWKLPAIVNQTSGLEAPSTLSSLASLCVFKSSSTSSFLVPDNHWSLSEDDAWLSLSLTLNSDSTQSWINYKCNCNWM